MDFAVKKIAGRFPDRPEIEEAFRMTPELRLTISRATAWEQKNTALRLRFSVRSQSASVRFVKVTKLPWEGRNNDPVQPFFVP